MKIECYIRVGRSGSVELLKGDGFKLNTDQVAFKLEAEIPDEVFAPKPVPTVRLSIPADSLIRQIEVDIPDVNHG